MRKRSDERRREKSEKDFEQGLAANWFLQRFQQDANNAVIGEISYPIYDIFFRLDEPYDLPKPVRNLSYDAPSPLHRGYGRLPQSPPSIQNKLINHPRYCSYSRTECSHRSTLSLSMSFVVIIASYCVSGRLSSSKLELDRRMEYDWEKKNSKKLAEVQW